MALATHYSTLHVKSFTIQEPYLLRSPQECIDVKFHVLRSRPCEENNIGTDDYRADGNPSPSPHIFSPSQ